jgi:hypothetical protein
MDWINLAQDGYHWYAHVRYRKEISQHWNDEESSWSVSLNFHLEEMSLTK